MALGFPGITKRDVVLLLSAHNLGSVVKETSGFGLPGFESSNWNGAHPSSVWNQYLRGLTGEWFGYYDPERKTQTFAMHDPGAVIHTIRYPVCYTNSFGVESCHKRAYQMLPVDMSISRKMRRTADGRIEGMASWEIAPGQNYTYWFDLSHTTIPSDMLDRNHETTDILSDYFNPKFDDSPAHPKRVKWTQDFFIAFDKMIKNGYEGDFSGSSELPKLVEQDDTAYAKYQEICNKSFSG